MILLDYNTCNIDNSVSCLAVGILLASIPHSSNVELLKFLKVTGQNCNTWMMFFELLLITQKLVYGWSDAYFILVLRSSFFEYAYIASIKRNCIYI